MCDTFMKRLDGSTWFAKNSDRNMNEPNLYRYYPPMDHHLKQVQTTYIEVPQVPHTYGVFLVQPSWMWGGEMGVNEFGVVIGNEAIFTKNRSNHQKALLGMDLLRLALERSQTAKQAVDTITQLLETYHQGGNAGFETKRYYDNSFLIIDQEDAFILQTFRSSWYVQPVTQQANISNRAHGSKEFAIQDQLFRSKLKPLFTYFSGSKFRVESVKRQLDQIKFDDINQIRKICQSHQSTKEFANYYRGSVRSVCMHQSILGDHTTASMIVQTTPSLQTIWVSNGSTPCLCVYLPIVSFPEHPLLRMSNHVALTYWVNRELLKRAYMSQRIDCYKYRQEQSELQTKIDTLFHQNLHTGDDEQLKNIQNQCFEWEKQWISTYQESIENIKRNPSLLRGMLKKRTIRLLQEDFFCVRT